MRKTKTPVKGTVFGCAVCGAEITVVRGGGGAITPVCCNQPMNRLTRPMHIYHCDVCGAEVAVLTGDEEKLKLVCCNEPMKLVTAGARAA